jgi:hypothetical protein
MKQRQVSDTSKGPNAADANAREAEAGTMPQLPARPPEQVSATDTRVLERLDALDRRLDKFEALLGQLVRQRTVKDWYDVEEAAQLLGKAEFTVREWCRLGRIRAQKRRSGRGAFPAWVIAHEEVLRYQREGLLPTRTPA